MSTATGRGADPGAGGPEPRTAPQGLSARRLETRARVLDAAYTVFAEKGLAGASVDDVAKAAGFTKGAVYSNFTTKEELFLELFVQRTEELLQVCLEVCAQVRETVESRGGPCGPDGGDGVEFLIGPLLERLLPMGRRWYLINVEFMAFSLRSDPSQRVTLATARQLRVTTSRLIADALALLGRRPTVPTDVFVDVLTGAFLHGVSSSLAEYVGPDDEERARSVHRTMHAVVMALTEPATA